MPEISTRAAVDGEHHLVARLKAALDNPKTSLGELMGLVQQALGELELGRHFAQSQASEIEGEGGAPLVTGLADAQVESLRQVLGSIEARL
jgi:hypothetical protein